uniref:uncharacterized protein ccdc33 isoform X2 n=1 Tax=Doryrhamphus excisus TaxID=161450 RepID=UPI0025ADDA98|nr:uncharacterized protein ccdc33 isoform X2 [Doryrhamphus excisus]
MSGTKKEYLRHKGKCFDWRMAKMTPFNICIYGRLLPFAAMQHHWRTAKPQDDNRVEGTTVAKVEHRLPPHNALAHILLDYKAHPSGANPKPNINHTYRPHKRPPLNDFEIHAAETDKRQTKEIQNYISVIDKMAGDIQALRTKVVMLELEIQQLRRDLSLKGDLEDTGIHATVGIAETQDIFKVARETSKAASQKDRIINPQNELIKLKHQKQQQHVQMATMVVSQQEKMENVNHRFSEKMNHGGNTRLVQRKQRAENFPVKTENQPVVVITQQPIQTKEAKERLFVLNKLEKDEAKIHTLEAKPNDNPEPWGRLKQDILSKLNDHRHDLIRTTPTWNLL